MAEDRTFTLIGRFDDHISPALAKINNSLAQLKTSIKRSTADLEKINKKFSSLGATINSTGATFAQFSRSASRSLKGIDGTIEKARDSVKGLQGSLQDLRGSLDMRDAAASVAGIADSFRDVTAAIKDARAALSDFNASGGGGGRGGNRRGRGPDLPDPGEIVGSGAGGGGTRGKTGFTIAKGYIAGILTSATNYAATQITSTISSGVNFVADKFKQAIEDELADYASAGAIYSMGKQAKIPWADTFQEAVKVQRDMDRQMAVLAASLPGNTDDYVRNAKMVSDTVAKMMVRQGADFVKAMEESAASLPQPEKITGSSFGAKQQSAFQFGTKELAKYATLTDMVNPSGGLPFNQLIEQILAQPTVSVNELKRRYNALKRNPLLSGAMEDYEAQINETAAGSVERLKLVLEMFRKMYPPEVLEAFERSFNGVAETMRTFVFSMESGIFGLKRTLRIVKDGKTYEETLYNVFRDIFQGFGVIVNPILEYLPRIFDPMKKMGEILSRLWFAAKESVKVFGVAQEQFRGAGFSGVEKNIRASITAMLSLAQWAGGDSQQITQIQSRLMSRNLDVGKALSDSLQVLAGSKLADEIGYAVGKLIGTILSDITKFLGSDIVTDANKGLVGGFLRGWKESGGLKAASDLFGMAIRTFFTILKDTVVLSMKQAPLETTALAAIFSGFVPALLSRFVADATESLSSYPGKGKATALPVPGGRGGERAKGGNKGLYALLDSLYPTDAMDKKRESLQRRFRRMRETGGSRFRSLRQQQYTSPIGSLPYGTYSDITRGRRDPFRSSRLSGIGQLSRMGRGLSGLAKLGGLGKMVPGGAMVAGAADLAASMAAGENFGKAAVTAFGTVLGGAAGSIFGPAGTVIGSMAGSAISRSVFDLVQPAIDQKVAAKMQLDAALKQIDAANKSSAAKYGDFAPKLGGIEALNRELGGGAGIRKFVQEQLTAGKILPEQAQQYQILATQLEQVNRSTSAVKSAQEAYDIAVRLNTGKQEEYKRKLTAAQNEQKAALSRITANWESMSTTSRVGILRSADGIRAALDQAAARIRAWSIPTITPNTTPSLIPGVVPPTSNSPIDRPGVRPSLNPNMPNIGFVARGSLGDAIASELKNKPFGSDLLIANSSETVIPAAKGYGMKDFMGSIQGGFRAVYENLKSLGLNLKISDENNKRRSEETDRQITSYHNQTQQQIAAINKNLASLSSISSGGMGGGLFGPGLGAGGMSSVVGVGRMLQGMGLNVGEHPSFGTGRVGKHAPNSYHYLGRAIDVTGSVAQLDAAYAKLKAMGRYKELLWRTAGHYDHLHVAYALGAGSPAFFKSQSAAQAWERSMVPGSVKVRSVTANSSEGLGKSVVNIGGVTVHAGHIQNPQELASLVAIEIGNAVADARAASIFV